MKYLIAASLLCLSFVSHGENLSAGFEVGPGDLTVNADFSAEASQQTVGSDTVVGFFGYEPIPNLILELNIFGSFTDEGVSTNVDQYRLAGTKLLVGYKINIGPRFSITPEVGRVSWTLTTDTDADDLDDDTETKKRGYDNVAQISANLAITKSIDLFAVYSDNKFDFGKDRSSRLGMTFNF